MDAKWKERLLEAAKRRDEGEEDEFLKLVDQAQGKCTVDVARVLMKTFTNKPDYGTQERVISVLATANDRDVAVALLEELPRLMNEAPEWVESLVGPEVDNRPDLLQSVATDMPANVQSSLRKLLANDDFVDFYPNAKNIRT